MTALLKTALELNTSFLVDNEDADAADVSTPFSDTQSHLRQGRISVTANDTHLKHLQDGLADDSTNLTWELVNAGANEQLRPKLNAKLIALMAFLAASGKLEAATGLNGIAPGANGGLGANAAAFTGLLKMVAGVAAVAVANTDYLAPAVAGKTLDATNDMRLGALDRTNAAGAAPGDTLVWNGTTYNPAAPGGGGAEPVDITITAGEALAERDFAFLDLADGKVYKLDADAATPLCGGIRGVINEAGGIAADAGGSMRILGEVSGYTGLTTWADVYASTTAGGYTQTKPTVTAGGGQQAVAKLGFATSPTKLMVKPEPVQYLKRASLANDASTTIVHHSDPQGRSRKPRAYVASTTAGVSLTTYGSANQDSDVHLSNKTVATYGTDQCTGGTPTASSTFGGFPASQAFDDNTSTAWASNSTQVAALQYQFGSTKAIRRYTIRARADAGAEAQAPGTFTLEYWNGSTWVVVDTRTSQTYTAGETKTFTFSSSATSTRWRINVTATQVANFVSIAEMEMLEVATYTDGATKLAQSFQVTGTQTIDNVKLWLKKVLAPAGTLTLWIETDNAGDPSGTLVDAAATVNVAESGLGTSYGWIDFNFAGNVTLSGSTPYWLVLSTSRSTDEFNFVDWGADGSSPGYASGAMEAFTSAWSAENKDAVFDVIAPAVNFDEPCTVGRASGGTRDIGVRFDDGAGADGNTKTTFTNKSGGLLDVTCVLEVAQWHTKYKS